MYALWPLRLGIALVFLVEGVKKALDPAGTAALMDILGVPLPWVAAVLVTAAEVLGGLAVLTGLYARAGAAALAVVMVGALAIARIPGPFFDGWAFDAVLLTGCLTVVLNGPGRPTVASVVREWRAPAPGPTEG